MMSQRIAALSRAARKCRGAVAYSVTATMLAFIACRDTGGVAGDVLHLRWSRPRLSSDPAGVAVAAADGSAAYIAEGDTVRALRLDSGTELWRRVVPDAGAATATRLLVDDNRVYITAWRAVALDKHTGTPLWSIPLETNAALSQNLTVDGTLYLGSRNHRVYALDAATGTQRWVTDLSGGSLLTGITKGMVSSGDTLFVATTAFLNQSGGRRRGVVTALDRRTGALIWRYDTPDSLSGADAAPALAPTTVIAGDLTGGATFALDRATGTLSWRKAALPGRFGPSAAAVVMGDLAYVGSNDAAVYALRAATGDEVWRKMRSASIAGISRCGRTLLLRHIDLGTSLLDLDSGAVLASPTLDRVALAASDFAVWERTSVVVGQREVIAFTCDD